jgi:hypothetical protein
MVFGTGGPWTDATQGSGSKMNKMTVISGPGDDLTLLTKTDYVIIKCTVDETGGTGLLKDHVYASSTDGTSWIDISHITFTPLDVFTASSKFMDTMGLYVFDVTKDRYGQTVTSTATIVDDTDGTTGEGSVKLATGATSGSAASIRKGGLKLNFAKSSFFQTKLRIGTASSLVYHGGSNVDLVTDADSNTVKYGAEICTATNNNWQVRSATGSAKSLSDYGFAISTNRVGIRLYHYPNTGTHRVEMYIDANAVFQKTSDIPITGVTGDTTLFRHSFKNSTAADRTLFIYGSRIAYEILDNWV